MQTALAVRDTWLIFADILTYVVIYFGTIVAVVGGFDWRVMLPFLGWLALYGLALSLLRAAPGQVAKAQADARSLMTGRVTDAYTNIATVKLFSHSQREAAFARGAMEEFMPRPRPDAAGERVRGRQPVLSVLLVGSTTGVTLWLWSDGGVGVGAVAAATAMALRLNGMSHWVMWEMASLFEHVGTVQDGMATLSRPHRSSTAPDAKALEVHARRGALRAGQLQLRRHAQGHRRPLAGDPAGREDRPGRPLGGRQEHGGEPAAAPVRPALGPHPDRRPGHCRRDAGEPAPPVGMVTQDTSLLHRSVRDNIVYGRPDAGDADMLRAAERAEAHDFIVGLTDPKGRKGYDAHVGERGVKLSGGQRQRVAIARVMLKDAPILLLDEATSALDSEVEAAIQTSLYRLMEGKTVVAIAHRLSTIAAMDRLVVMEHGRIVETGDHQSLLAAGGIYARLWAHQSGGFLGEEPDDEAERRTSSSASSVE
jgi:ATP-binding cassette subfamily B multidrug efflux pump